MTKDESLKLAQEPEAWEWQQAPIKTMWGDEMVVADLAIDKDHTVSIYCERDQAAKVEAMFTQPAAPVQEPVAWMEALKDAFFEGFTSVETYNDSLLNSPEEAWAKYTPPAASVQQEPVGRVVSANCEYATVQWLRQTSKVGGGDPKNSLSWPIAGDAVYTAPPAAQRQWVGLTDEEKQEWIDAMPYTIEPRHCMILVNVMEAKLKEKNT